MKLTDDELCLSEPSVLNKSGFSPQLHQRLLLPVLRDSSSTHTTPRSTSDEFLLRAIEVAKSSGMGKDKNALPFEINRDGSVINLRRVYQDEIITCTISDAFDFSGVKPRLVVKSQIAGEGIPIKETEGNSGGITLSIDCTTSGGYWSKIKIERLTIYNSGHMYSYGGEQRKFSELDRVTQRSMEKYLEARGIKSSIIKHLQKHKNKLESSEDIKWLPRLHYAPRDK